jgi:hypothetical protein
LFRLFCGRYRSDEHAGIYLEPLLMRGNQTVRRNREEDDKRRMTTPKKVYCW